MIKKSKSPSAREQVLAEIRERKGKIVYEGDPACAAVLAATGRPYAYIRGADDRRPGAKGPLPLGLFVETRAGLMHGFAYLFLGPLAAGGREHFVAVSFHVHERTEEARTIDVAARVYDERLLWSDPVAAHKAGAFSGTLVRLRHSDVLRVYAAESCPTDPSSFTASYFFNGEAGALKGTLNEDLSVSTVDLSGKLEILRDPE